jgi:hypothetical protein
MRFGSPGRRPTKRHARPSTRSREQRGNCVYVRGVARAHAYGASGVEHGRNHPIADLIRFELSGASMGGQFGLDQRYQHAQGERG